MIDFRLKVNMAYPGFLKWEVFWENVVGRILCPCKFSPYIRTFFFSSGHPNEMGWIVGLRICHVSWNSLYFPRELHGPWIPPTLFELRSEFRILFFAFGYRILWGFHQRCISQLLLYYQMVQQLLSLHGRLFLLYPPEPTIFHLFWQHILCDTETHSSLQLFVGLLQSQSYSQPSLKRSPQGWPHHGKDLFYRNIFLLAIW